MDSREDQMDEKDLRICSSCVGESFLSAKIQSTGEELDCDYCTERGMTITIDTLANEIESAFDQHFRRTSPDPTGIEYVMLKQGHSWDRSGEKVVDVISEIAEIDVIPARDVHLILQDRHSDQS